MLHYDRIFESAELGVTMSHRAVMSPGFRIYELATTGVVFDQGKLGGPGQRDERRAQANLVCDGTLTLRRGGREIPARRGEVFVEWGIDFDEVWEGEPFRAICLDWICEDGPERAVHKLSEAGLEELGDITLDCPRPERARAARRAARLLLDETQLSAPVDELMIEVDPDLQRISDVYASLLSDLGSQPMWCDFTSALGISERQLRRHMSEFLGWFPIPTDERNFRWALRRQRMARGLALMTAPGATVSKVASLLGYGSSVAFTNACQSAGLGAPSEFAKTRRRSSES